MFEPAGRRRLLMLLLLLVLAAGIVVEQARANALDATCGTICAEECVLAGGCRYFASSGCNCKYQCDDGTQGVEVCGVSR